MQLLRSLRPVQALCTRATHCARAQLPRIAPRFRRSQRDPLPANPRARSLVLLRAMPRKAVTGGSSSLSNPEKARVTHTDLQFDVHFDSKTLKGHVEHTVAIEEDGTAEVVFDTRDLTVHSVTVAGAPTEHSFGESQPALGQALSVRLPPVCKQGDVVAVGIAFTTSPSASATQWLEPSQTAGGKHPYLFTQCQAIHARSLLPCQDTPGAKMTYSAAVRVPAGLTALMSAVPDSSGPIESGELSRVGPRAGGGPCAVFRFTQAQPISTYLLALAVGELERRELGPISAVWSEPSVVDAAAYEFGETNDFLEAAAAIAGPYRWGRYDLLLLPPSFPYGGMENPCLTFVTPTLLAGDRSLANVVAHEIAHSWTGNLVTNAGWESFWLNEGWTVWLERKILGRLQGEKAYQLQAALGLGKLAKTVSEQFEPDHPYTRLVPDLSGGVDPDDAFSSIPYEKGFYLLHYLQTLVGGPASFEPFFRHYVETWAATPVTSDDFKAFFLQYFKDTPAVKDIDWDTWFYATGMPPAVNSYDDSLATEAYDLAKRWHTADVLGLGSSGGPEGASPSDIQGWSSTQVVAFLEKLGELRSMTPLHASTCRKMSELYGLDDSRNAEIRASWYQLAIKAGDEAVLPHVQEFLSEQGRMKYLRPLYRALYRSQQGRQLALDTFEAHKASYHPIAAKMVAADLQKKQ